MYDAALAFKGHSFLFFKTHQENLSDMFETHFNRVK